MRLRALGLALLALGFVSTPSSRPAAAAAPAPQSSQQSAAVPATAPTVGVTASRVAVDLFGMTGRPYPDASFR